MRELSFEEVGNVEGGSIGEAAASGLAGAGVSRGVAMIAGVTLGPGAAAGVLVGGFVMGVALYYLTD